ncbi:MAG: class I SAM-dependent methyltransferase [Alphaproteobacteria bacterium]|nr:class I SAM-dependent methyltransferase [Alphaproteobacteria bacterium]
MAEESVFLPVAEAYDRWAPGYDAYDNPMVFAAAQAVEAMATRAAGRDVFEFGCGTGRNLAVLKRHGAAAVAGCDLSEGMLARARERDPAFSLLRHDMNLPLDRPAGSADLVLFSLALEHVAELGAPLSEAKRILRPGGAIAVIEIHPALSLGGLAAHFKDAAGEVRMPTFAHCFADYLNAFAALDLRVAHCREWRPRDFAVPAPDKALRRGADHPLVVEFVLATVR